MPAQVQIDFVSDVACPWCAIGFAGLEEALGRTQGVVDAELRFHPFELNPHMPPGGENIDAYLGSRHGMSAAQLAATRGTLKARGADVGMHINQDSHSRIYNTFDAHRLLHWARDSGRQRALKRALFEANFTAGADVSDHAVLARAAAAAGLDEAEARQVLASGEFGEEVRAAEAAWQARGIHSVPAIVINGQWLISGGQPPDLFEEALRTIARGS
ncbi:MAG TPA: DsbA family oxidoreductase [Steroidobacteraceae bacterium]|nr:DsbA family oxidoreductase [Steroidobacteraceae bacterium]